MAMVRRSDGIPVSQRIWSPPGNRCHNWLTSGKSVLAEVEHVSVFTPQRSLGELPATFGTEIETHVLTDFVSDFIILDIFHPLEDIMNLLKVIAIVVNTLIDRIEDCRYLDLDFVTEIVLGIEIAFAKIARITNHQLAPQS